MKKTLVILFLSLFTHIYINGQTLYETQMRNARATGYAIVAARNPGMSFTIYVITWDGVNSLEYNANSRINPGWHAQAAIKGNYFNQTFDGTDFSTYSSVVVSQEEFDLYKNTGTQWWIVCSTLPPFSNSNAINSYYGNVGIGTAVPQYLLSTEKSSAGGTVGMYVKNTGGNSPQTLTRFSVGMTPAETSALLVQYDHNTNEALVLNRKSASGTLDLSTTGGGIRISNNGNVGIGTTNPGIYRLNVSGKIRTDEIVVNTSGADFVFEPEYKLPELSEIAKYVKENKRLPDIPSAKEMQEAGMNVSEMQTKLLQKIEEITLYLIELKKENMDLKKEIEYLKN